MVSLHNVWVRLQCIPDLSRSDIYPGWCICSTLCHISSKPITLPVKWWNCLFNPTRLFYLSLSVNEVLWDGLSTLGHIIAYWHKNCQPFCRRIMQLWHHKMMQPPDLRPHQTRPMRTIKQRLHNTQPIRVSHLNPLTKVCRLFHSIYPSFLPFCVQTK